MPPLFPTRILEITCLALASSLLLVSLDSSARSTDREQELMVNAGGLDGMIDPDGDTILTEVTIQQGSLRIEAGRATVTRKAGDVTRVLLEGSPASLQQENDDGQLMRAQAQRIEYGTNDETVLLVGAVHINQGRDEFRGEQVRYDTRNGRITGEGGTNNRIQLIIHPKTRTTAD